MNKEDKDLAFNGQAGDGVNRDKGSNRLSGNQSGLEMKEHFGNGPRTAKVLADRDAKDVGPSVTKDKFRTAPATAAGLKPNEGKTTVKKVERK